MPGGMKIVATCCQAHSFPDDDTVAIDYSEICNSASRLQMGLGLLSLIVVSAVMLF